MTTSLNGGQAVGNPDGMRSTRRLAVFACMIFAVVIGQLQQLVNLGQSPAEFSADSDATLKVVGWAFAIWGPIYLGLIVYAIRQLLPRTHETEILKAFGWPSVLALLGIGWWILAAAWDLEVATIVLIFGSLIVLLIPLLRKADAIRDLSNKDRDRWMTVWPLAALAGWLTVAAPVNLLTVATGNGDLPAALPPTGWALIAVVAAAGMGLLVTWRTRVLAYPLPIAWGLLGVFVAEQEKGNAVLAFGALAASLVVLGGALTITFGLRPRR
ncbi:hypothetical protein [Brevundimonas sp. NIBR11]|uniref:hypothetical protein n=1 Tax=Brevundimonas sp. NIBR11 TaxID=3015999 RepID=UPI0022F11638|nr:hypothetical protein [Brevundimonas sp. NIBR11]WGM30299.1 hypothetical protein KKHFBJBL_00515 [Brevundimonas sp. NIBR11]